MQNTGFIHVYGVIAGGYFQEGVGLSLQIVQGSVLRRIIHGLDSTIYVDILI